MTDIHKYLTYSFLIVVGVLALSSYLKNEENNQLLKKLQLNQGLCLFQRGSKNFSMRSTDVGYDYIDNRKKKCLNISYVFLWLKQSKSAIETLETIFSSSVKFLLLIEKSLESHISL